MTSGHQIIAAGWLQEDYRDGAAGEPRGRAGRAGRDGRTIGWLQELLASRADGPDVPGGTDGQSDAYKKTTGMVLRASRADGPDGPDGTDGQSNYQAALVP